MWRAVRHPSSGSDGRFGGIILFAAGLSVFGIVADEPATVLLAAAIAVMAVAVFQLTFRQ
jgi:hypothetical protein